MGDVLDKLVATQPTPPLYIVIVTAVLALGVVIWRPLWKPARNIVTIAHEGGHALIALLTGRRLHGIRLHSDTSGLTMTYGSQRGPSAVFTLMAGYMAPALIGLGASFLISQGLIVMLLWAILALLVAMALFIRNVYGWIAMILTAFAVFALVWWAPANVQTAIAYGGAWFLLVGSVRPVAETWTHRRRPGVERTTDPDQLAGITKIPAVVWIGMFYLVTLGSLVLGAKNLIGFSFPG
ncbi:membrane protein [Actinorhabdospora filicis]|uniref:Membrane protein n=1 Tax=Actinorhabdospora filicis TaxID=1785913 RepID=A0A9W6WBY1_9ACTN|nr:M50 family metallopeptidase [Actinorhabdospora filicis]GLZ81094.1 membrane protein [Actinorhabdospora filicis]